MNARIRNFGRAVLLLLSIALVMTGCNKDEDQGPKNGLTGNIETFSLFDPSGSTTTGTVKFEEREDKSTRVTITFSGASGEHPAHIHVNTAAEGGGIAIDLNPIDASGSSVTEVSAKKDGSTIYYSELINFDGHINVHKSASELGVVIAQGDIGENVLTGNHEDYDLFEGKVSGISGEVTFYERKNGETLVIIELNGTKAGGDHPAHIHANTVVEGGPVMVPLTNVDGSTGIGKTNVTQLKDGTPMSFSDWDHYNGYVQVHNSPSDLGTPIALGDIGENKLTGKSEMYSLMEKSGSGIDGSVKFEERKSGVTLVTLMLNGTTMGETHPAHIHMNTAAEGGGIAIDLTAVDGEMGKSYTNVSTMKDGTPVTYDDLVDFNGYVNIHKSASEIATLIAQGDIGQNALTGTFIEYNLNEQNASGISGTITFAERNDGFTLITIKLNGTKEGDSHPVHIHNGDIANPGGIAISLNNVDGKSGMSMTSVSTQNDGTEIKYNDLTNFDGYAIVHESDANLASVLANGNIGKN